MRRYAIPLCLLAAGCTLAPQAPTPQPTRPVPQSPQVRSDLLGLTATDLVQRLGTPALQIREGPGLKLQFRSRSCVLDAYLYPEGRGPERVTHVDARLRSGADTDQRACLATLQGA